MSILNIFDSCPVSVIRVHELFLTV